MWNVHANHLRIRSQGCEATNPFGNNTWAGIFDSDKRWLAMSLESTPQFQVLGIPTPEPSRSRICDAAGVLEVDENSQLGNPYSVGAPTRIQSSFDRLVSASLGRIKPKPQTKLCPILPSQFNPAKASAGQRTPPLSSSISLAWF